MGKGTGIVLLAILGLALPFTLLALAGAAWLTENLTAIATAVGGVDVPALFREGWSRWPEILGMFIGQALIVLILVLARKDLKAQSA
jgi:cytochrome c biogenesis protein CcdA